MRRLGVIIICCVFILSGCSRADTPLDTQRIFDVLSLKQENNETIEIMSNPAIVYSVEVTDELLLLLNIEHWKPCSADEANTNIDTMLYFDISHTNIENEFSRVAVLSNGYALIQRCTDEGLEEKEWYNCGFPESTTYEKIADYILKNDRGL